MCFCGTRMALLRMIWELLCGEACCVLDGLWHPPAQVQTLPGVPLPVSSAKQ